ncbi:MAG TPA: LPS assembly protein LptD [Opitutus sp.]|nr:LPS assembly protein LptD [Opitutus sp.]
MIRRLLLFLSLATAAVAATPDATAVYAEHLETSTRTGETILTGNPYVDYGDVRLTADEIRIHPQTRIAVASGNATLTRGPRRLLADKITYNSATGAFEVGDLRVGEFPVYISGASATGDAESLTIADARVSMPEPGPLVPTLQAARVFFSRGQQVQAEGAALGLGNVRPLSLPGVSHNVRGALIPFVAVSGGYRRTLGVYLEGSLQVPVSDRLRLGGDLGLYSNRGIMAGPSGSYAADHGEANYQGEFRSGFISDYGTRYEDVLGRRVPRERGFAEWRHQQQVNQRVRIAGELNYWSDSEVVRDFRPSDFFNVQQPDNFVEAAYTGDNYLASLFTRVQPNSFQVVQQRLPELRFDLLPSALAAGFNHRFNASLAVLREDGLPTGPLNPVARPQLRSDRLDAYYALSRPVRPTDWFTFTPVAGGRITHYANLDGPREDYTRTVGELGFDSELRASGTYEYKNERWKIDGLRHLLTPRLSYRYIPEAEKGARYIPPIDRRSFSTYLQPLGLGAIRHIDDLHGTNTLRLGVDNTLQTRDPVYGSRDLVVLNVANDFRFERRPGERRTSAIHTELAVMPARWLELGVYQSFTPQDRRQQEFNTGVTIRDGDEWAMRFASNYLRGELNDYLVSSSRRFNEAFEGIVHLRYDARRRRFNEQAYGVRQNIGNMWSIEYTITLYDGPRRESRFGFNVRVDAVRF